MNQELDVAPEELIIESILIIRGQKVMLDSDLAMLYGISVGQLNQAVKRNTERFPMDFVFQITNDELKTLKSQIVISNRRGGRRTLPYAFTEHGALMAATVLNRLKMSTSSLTKEGKFTTPALRASPPRIRRGGFK